MLGQIYTASHIREQIADLYHLIVALSAYCLDGRKDLATLGFKGIDTGL